MACLLLYNICLVRMGMGIQRNSESQLTKFHEMHTSKFFFQKQPSRGILRKRHSENLQQIYRRTPMPKCDFNKFTNQLFGNQPIRKPKQYILKKLVKKYKLVFTNSLRKNKLKRYLQKLFLRMKSLSDVISRCKNSYPCKQNKI